MSRLIIGCGYLGLRVATLWQQQGDDVHVTTRSSGLPLRDLGFAVHHCDVVDAKRLTDLPAVETVVYAVGFDRSAGVPMRKVYVDGLANVLAHLPPPGRFIYVSSSSVYGQTDGGWVDENAVTEPAEESGKIVLATEKVLRERLPGAIILRFSGIYGPGRLLRRGTLEKGEPIVGDADKWLNLIQVDDGVQAVLAAARHAVPGCIYNVCDDQPVRRRDFYTELAHRLGAPPPRFVPPPTEAPPPHELAHRRIRNTRLKDELHVTLRYPDYRAGLAASV